jgi:acyl-CoA synthetase (NDP forming)/RimJ/RimL family protein N-acetyltransferase
VIKDTPARVPGVTWLYRTDEQQMSLLVNMPLTCSDIGRTMPVKNGTDGRSVPDGGRKYPEDVDETAPADDLLAVAPYPSDWEADVVLRDGGTAHLRPIRPDDTEALQTFHVAQSPESVYLRFFAPMPRLSDRDLFRFTHVDYHERVAFVITVGGEIIGIGRYDQVNPSTAEVAFNISDAHHGRGIGSVLLEHLAAAARENGVHKFVAEVLPQNRKMMAVFRDAGYEINHRYDDGVISLSFQIDPTEASRAVMEAREHRAEARSVRALLNPTSVVLIGASRREGTIGHRLLSDMLAGSFTGRLHVVHPEADEVLGTPALRRLADVPGDVDLAIIAVPAPAVLDVVAECATKRVRGLVVVSGGFAEEGAEGLARQRELVHVARANGMRVVGPNSWGLINADDDVRLNVSLMADLPESGRLGLFAQSAASSVTMLDSLERRGLGTSTFVSTGNRADVSANDCMQYWEEDEQTDIVGMFIESIGNPRKFSRIARRLSRAKPVIVVKTARSGFVAPPGHAVRPSVAPARAFDALLAQSGCIQVENVRQLFDVAQFLTTQPLPEGPRVAVVANTHGLAAQLTDACATWELAVVRTPTVLPTVAGSEEFQGAMDAAFAADDVDSVVAAFVPPLATHASDVAAMLSKTSGSARQPAVACFLGLSGIRDRVAAARAVPTYPSPEEAVRALALATRYRAWRDQDPGHRVEPEGCDRATAQALVELWLAETPQGLELDAVRTTHLLDCYGVTLWPALPITDHRDAAEAATTLGWPVALKSTAPHLRHRVDLGGVRLGIGGPTELADHLAAMRRTLGPLGGHEFVVQRMAPGGVACVVRTVEDPLFGPVVSFGVGGDAMELLDDVAYRIPPLTDVDVVDLVRSVRCAPKLFGHRGARPVNVAGLYDVIARVACLSDDLPEIATLELNPVVVSDDSVAVLDATIRLAPDPGRTDAGRRELTDA